MSDYSPTSSAYKTPATSPSQTFFNTDNNLRFAPHVTGSATTENVVMVDTRTVQQWQLDMALARVEGTTNQLEARLFKATFELDREVTRLHYEMNTYLRLRKEDLKKAQRRHNQTLLLCVLFVLLGMLMSCVFQHHGASKLLDRFDFG
ncbi:hypothetical protein F52700_8444 [Fusarium sp. NRRL 52700]|nr:hypothetical protein F52700_8444 [Fusarium sp. NRRL 52700]